MRVGAATASLGETKTPGSTEPPGAPDPASPRSSRCALCEAAGGPIEGVAAWGPYEGRIRDLIHALKYKGRYGLSNPLGAMMADALSRSGLVVRGSDPVLVPVPLSKGRLAGRGYNQAALLARSVKRSLSRSGVARPIVIEALTKTRDGPPQAGLSREQRIRNPVGTFAPARRSRSGIEGRSIVLVDDVVTTGATAGECAAVLARAGAGPISIAAVARVPSRGGRP